MKSILALSVAAITLTSGLANARPNCPGGMGYWEEIERNVRVCDKKTETYTVTLKDCQYDGVLHRGYLWNQPIYPSQVPFSKSVTEYARSVSSCPSSKTKTEQQVYWYRDDYGVLRTDFVHYSGTLNKVLETSRTETRTREVETNCRTERRVTRVFRCGFEP